MGDGCCVLVLVVMIAVGGNDDANSDTAILCTIHTHIHTKTYTRHCTLHLVY